MGKALTIFDEKQALDYYPFDGDETDVKLFSDKFVVGRKEYECHWCNECIAKGERHRALTELNREDRQIETFRFCPACSEAMAFSWEDGGDAIDARTQIRKANDDD